MKNNLESEIEEFINKHIHSENFESPYFRNFLIGHYKTLKSSFRNIEKILGEQLFKNLVMEFVFKHPPKIPDLNIYGAEFPSFLLETNKLDVAWIKDLAMIDYKSYINDGSEKTVSIMTGVMSVWECLEENSNFEDVQIDEDKIEKWKLVNDNDERYWIKEK